MHTLLAAVWLALVSPVVSPGRIYHARFIAAVRGAANDLSGGSRIDFQILAKGKQEKKMLERLIATAEWDGWTVSKTGNRIVFVPPSIELATGQQ